jgi:ATP-dependent Clp protease ATP-binding subunit ClpA
MFERFTEESRAVVVEAHDLAIELGSPSIETGHLLCGCAQEGGPTAAEPMRACGITTAVIRRLLPRGGGQPTNEIDAESLRAIGIDYEGVRAAVEETFGPGALASAPDRRVAPGSRRHPRFTPAAKEAMKLTLAIATRELHHGSLMPGHLLLGLLRLDDQFVSTVLERSGTTVSQLSAAVLTQLSPPQQRPA